METYWQMFTRWHFGNWGEFLICLWEYFPILSWLQIEEISKEEELFIVGLQWGHFPEFVGHGWKWCWLPWTAVSQV